LSLLVLDSVGNVHQTVGSAIKGAVKIIDATEVNVDAALNLATKAEADLKLKTDAALNAAINGAAHVAVDIDSAGNTVLSTVDHVLDNTRLHVDGDAKIAANL